MSAAWGPVTRWLAGMPKAELHLHIDGSLRAPRLLQLAEKHGVSLPYATVADVEAAYDFRDLQSFLDLYYLGASVLRDAQSLGLLPHLLGGFEGEAETFDMLEQIDRRTAAGSPIEEYLALAALFLADQETESMMAVMPADHVITDRKLGRTVHQHSTIFTQQLAEAEASRVERVLEEALATRPALD